MVGKGDLAGKGVGVVRRRTGVVIHIESTDCSRRGGLQGHFKFCLKSNIFK